MADRKSHKIAILWRGDREARRAATSQNNGFYRVFEELAAVGIDADPAVYDEDIEDEVHCGTRGYCRIPGLDRRGLYDRARRRDITRLAPSGMGHDRRPRLTGSHRAGARAALDHVPIHSLQLAIGILLLLFGMGWLRKASLRAAGIIPLHDEDAIFAAEAAQLDQQARRQQRSLNWAAGVTALKAVLLEGLEVVFIVIAGWGPDAGCWCPPASVRSPPAS